MQQKLNEAIKCVSSASTDVAATGMPKRSERIFLVC